MREGKGKGDASVWINAIEKETHGWPQHIQCYASLASDYLKANNGVMTSDGLNTVLEVGNEDREEYYRGRFHRFRQDETQCLARSIAGVHPGTPMEYTDLIAPMAQKYGDDKAEKLFKKFEERGILDQTDMGYVVPIPSMHIWLKDTYIKEESEIPGEIQQSSLEHSIGSEDEGMTAPIGLDCSHIYLTVAD